MISRHRVAVLAVCSLLLAAGSTLAVAPVNAEDGPWFACADGSAYLSTPTTSATVAQGNAATFPITINRLACPDPVSFDPISGLPPGVVATFSPAVTTGDLVTLTVRTSKTWPTVTPPGGFRLEAWARTANSYPGSYLNTYVTVTPAIAPIAQAPGAQLRSGSTIAASTVPVRIQWSATDPNGIKSYHLQRQANGGSWVTVKLSSPTATFLTQSLKYRTTYRYRVRATDKLGNTGAYAYGRPFVPKLVQQTTSGITSPWRWTTVYTSSASGGSLKYTKPSGSEFTYSFSAASVAWVSVKGPTRSNWTEVYVDNDTEPKVVNLTTSSVRYRRVVYAKNFGANGKHKLWVHNLGMVGRSRLDIDAFVLLIHK